LVSNLGFSARFVALYNGLVNLRTRVRLQVVARVKAVQRSNTLRRELLIFRAPL
jgi:hypothetical protein